MVNRILNELFYPIRAQQNKANNTEFRTGKPVNTAPEWTGHVTSSANHCMRIRSKPMLFVSKAIISYIVLIKHASMYLVAE